MFPCSGGAATACVLEKFGHFGVMPDARPDEPTDLEGVLDRLMDAVAHQHHGRVTVADVQHTIGQRSFGPLLLVPGLIGLSPIGAIPGLPGVMAVIELFFTWQILFGMQHPWLPDFLLRRSIASARLKRGVEVLRPAARWVDYYLLAPRLTFFTRGLFFQLIALTCFFLSIIMPIIEIVPLAGIVPNAALTAFGLAVTAHDGLWALVAFAFTFGSIYLLAMLF